VITFLTDPCFKVNLKRLKLSLVVPRDIIIIIIRSHETINRDMSTSVRENIDDASKE